MNAPDGLDKTGNIAAQAAAEARENKPAPLEPEFPWTVFPFPMDDLVSSSELFPADF